MSPAPLPTIAIIGLGWLGLPLARHMQSLGYPVRGSKQSSDAASQLQREGLDAHWCSLSPEPVSEPVSEPPSEPEPAPERESLSYLLQADIVVVNIPPGRAGFQPGRYSGQIRQLLRYQQQINPGARWLFVSSTSAYRDENRRLTESDPASASQGSGGELADIEQMLLARIPPAQISIVRLGGLIGAGRHPAKFLAGRTLSGGEQPVNLLHLDDAIGIITRLIRQPLVTRPVINACAPGHPTRQQFYSQACRQLGLAEPEFIQPAKACWKQVDSQWLTTDIAYRFVRPDPMSWLDEML